MIIGICGHQGAGKSTVCEVAINLGRPVRPFIRMGFSDPLYLMLIAMGLPEEIVYNKERWNEPLDILCGLTTRYACDTLGNNWGRDGIGPEVWGNMAIAKARQIEASGRIAVIDNVRYLSEARQVIEAGGEIIGFHRHAQEPDLTKPSEREIPLIWSGMCSYHFWNMGRDLQNDAINFRVVLDAMAEIN